MSARVWRVGMTGGIASGKSTVATMFAELGVPVIELDQVARDVVQPGSELLARILARFGASLRAADGSLDRRALRSLVFADPAARRDLEQLTHPAILARTEELSRAAGGPYQIIVNPLLVEQHAAGRYDRVLVVECEPHTQRQRLRQRDAGSEHELEAMIAAQATREQRHRVAHDVLSSEGGPAALRPQVLQLHQLYLRLAGDGASRAQ